MATKVKIVNAKVWELHPDNAYVIGVDKYSMTEVDAQRLLRELKTMGINNAVGIFTQGDPNKTLKIIQQVKPVQETIE